jgi:hypothetical protein
MSRFTVERNEHRAHSNFEITRSPESYIIDYYSPVCVREMLERVFQSKGLNGCGSRQMKAGPVPNSRMRRNQGAKVATYALAVL